MSSETGIGCDEQDKGLSLLDYMLLLASAIILANAIFIHWFF